jgi:hypothetical protein
VPRGAGIEAHGRDGDITVLDVDGSVTVDSDNAGVRLEKIGGDVRVNLASSDSIELRDIGGQVTVKGTDTGKVEFQHLAKSLHYSGTLLQQLDVEKIPGQIKYESGGITGSGMVGVVLRATSTDVHLLDFTKRLNLTLTGSGEIRLRPGDTPVPEMVVSADSNNIDLELPSPASFVLDMKTGRGRADNKYGDSLKAEYDGTKASISGGPGGPRIQVTTGWGNITVRKYQMDDTNTGRGPLPAPPTPPRPARSI